MHWFLYPRKQTADGAERAVETESARVATLSRLCAALWERVGQSSGKAIKGLCGADTADVSQHPKTGGKPGCGMVPLPHHPPLQRIPALSGLPNLTLYAKWESPTPSCPYNPALKNILLGLNKNISQNLCQVSVFPVSLSLLP